jgi:hypothetical protein
VFALVRIRKQIETQGLRPGYFTLAHAHVEDRDSTCRWQATIVIGEFIRTKRDLVWSVAKRLATSPNPDIRMASATLLLEHLLQQHTSDMIPKFKAELALGDRRFRESVGHCWNLGDSRTRARIQRLLDTVKRSNRPL